MKVKNKIFVFALILSLILTAGCVAAADNMTFDQSDLELVSSQIDIEMDQNEDDSDILQAENQENENSPIRGESETQLLSSNHTVDGDDFSSIQTVINDASEGDTIFLGGKTYTGTDSLDIGKNKLTIIGGSQDNPDDIATLDGQGLTRIISVSANNITIKGVKFINANGKYGNGGAIYWAGDYGTLMNADFINNTAFAGGGFWWNSPNGVATDLKFINNTARYGGAVCWMGANGALNNSDFINNDGGRYAGAIRWYGANAKLNNSNFINNTAFEGIGAVEFSSENGVLTNCNFTGNSATDGANGALAVFNANVRISDSTFKNNTAFAHGALGIAEQSVNTIISGCTFENNFALYNQGAVVVDALNVTLKDSTFNNNWANEAAGAIGWRVADGNLINTTFTKNNASDGGAVQWTGANGNAKNITFKDNFASNYGGAVQWTGYGGKVSNSTFINNHAVEGGATDWTGTKGTLKDSKFENNSADNTGGASRWSGADATVGNCEYINNTAKIGGAIHSIADGLTVDGNTFDENGAVYAGSDLSVGGPNTSILNNKINNSGSNVSSVYVTNFVNFTQSGNTFTDWSKSFVYSSLIIEVDDVYIGRINKNLIIPVYVHDAEGVPALGQLQLYGYDTKRLTDGRTQFNIAMPNFQTTMYLTMVYEDGVYKNFMVEVIDNTSPIEEIIQPDNGKDEVIFHFPKDATGNVTLTINEKKFISNVGDGFAVIEITGLPNGNYSATAHYSGDANYSAITIPLNVTVKYSNFIPQTKLSANSDVSVIYSGKAYYKALVTRDGRSVGAGESVTINFNGKNTVVRTDANGYINYKIPSSIKPKTYTIKATYYGSSVTNKVKIIQVIKASNKKVKKSKKVTKIKIKLKKVNGKYLKKKTLKIKFNKKTYKVKTNKKGVATWKVKKSMLKKLKVGKKVKYTVTYGKATLTKKLTIKK